MYWQRRIAELRRPTYEKFLAAAQKSYGKYMATVQLWYGAESSQTVLKFSSPRESEIKHLACLKLLAQKNIISLKEEKDQYRVQINKDYMDKKIVGDGRSRYGVSLKAGYARVTGVEAWSELEQEYRKNPNHSRLLGKISFTLAEKEPWYTDDIVAVCPADPGSHTFAWDYVEGKGWK